MLSTGGWELPDASPRSVSLDLLLGVARVGQQVVEVGLGELADELQPLHLPLVPRLVRPLLGDLAPPFLLLVLFDDCNNALVINHPSRIRDLSIQERFHPCPNVFMPQAPRYLVSRYYLDIQNSDDHHKFDSL